MSIKFLVLGGGGYSGFWGGGGKCRFYFYGRGDFSEPFWCNNEMGPSQVISGSFGRTTWAGVGHSQAVLSKAAPCIVFLFAW